MPDNNNSSNNNNRSSSTIISSNMDGGSFSPTGRKQFLELLRASDGGFLEQQQQEQQPLDAAAAAGNNNNNTDTADTANTADAASPWWTLQQKHHHDHDAVAAASIDNIGLNEETIRASNASTTPAAAAAATTTIVPSGAASNNQNHHGRSKSSLPGLFVPPSPPTAPQSATPTTPELFKPQPTPEHSHAPPLPPPIQPQTTMTRQEQQQQQQHLDSDDEMLRGERISQDQQINPTDTNSPPLPENLGQRQQQTQQQLPLPSALSPPRPKTNYDPNSNRNSSSSSSSNDHGYSPPPHHHRQHQSQQIRFPPRPPAIGTRDRAVSFDAQAMQKDQEQQQQQQQQLQQLQQQQQQQQQQRALFTTDGAGARIFNLDEILSAGPYELEAETNILKAIEQQPSQSHRRFRSETSTILSNVPENMGHDFSLDWYQNGIEVEKTDSLIETDGSGGVGIDRVSFEHTASSGREKNTAEDLDIEQNIPLIKAHKKHHRRSMSVEDRLAGLTTEMSLLRQKPGPLTKAEIRAERRPLNNTISSADSFLQNSVVVTNNTEDGSLPSKSKASDVLSQGLSRVDEGDDGEEEEDSSTSSSGASGPNQSTGTGRESTRRSRLLSSAADTLKDDLEIWSSFFNPRKEHIVAYTKTLILYFGFPLLVVSALLFYAFDNPPTGESPDGSPGSHASASWWLLFVLRQSGTLSIALLLQMIVIDFLSVSTRLMLRIVGPIITLLIVQSKGWPFVCLTWGLLNFGLLHGDRDFSRHWMYWQEPVRLFNNHNPSGQVVDSTVYTQILIVVCCVSVVVAIKRFVLGLFLSRNTFHHYGESLAKLMSKMVLISQVAQLAKKIERSKKSKANSVSMAKEPSFAQVGMLKSIYSSNDLEGQDESLSVKSDVTDARSVQTKILAETLDDTNKMKLLQLLGEWEEPDSGGLGRSGGISISAVLRFRNALNLINKDIAFSLAFGNTNSREACIESSQNVYSRLLMANPEDGHVHFETLGLMAVDSDGNIDEEKARELVKVFRPRRDGVLTMLDFVKSVDSVYKELRLLDASIENASQIDRAFENIINVIFYVVLLTLILFFFGLDPLAFFLSLTSIILAFAFMIGSAASKYFEGILFILVRRPYDIGDIVHFSNPVESDNPNGSIGWIIQKVSLFETEGVWVPTLERASFNNGSLASSQIINWRRSPNARMNVQLNFPIETKYEQLEIFKSAIEEYIRIRPREWLCISGFRCNRIFTEQSYMNVTLLLQHREPWQSVGAVLDSKANLVSFSHEVQKKLGMQYKAPPLPIHIQKGDISQFLEHPSSSESITAGSGSAAVPGTGAAVRSTSTDDSDSAEAKMNHFRWIAKTQHQIRSG